jgi:hypothetical protein
MISQDEARARVARGAAMLDERRPGWFHRIDPGVLDLQSGCACIIGQLFDGYTNAYQEFTEWTAYSWRSAHGFTVNSDTDLSDTDLAHAEMDEAFKRLQDAWIDAIAARLHPVREAIPTETPVTA